MDKQKKYSLRKIAGIGLTSCVVGISVMNMPVQAEEGTDAATIAVSETVENAEATSPSESADVPLDANNEATANEASTTAAEQPAVEEEAANPVEEPAEQPAAEEEAASQPSETEEVAPESQNKEAQPSNSEATTNNTAQPANKDTELISGNGGLSVWYVSEKDKYSKSELGVQLTVDGKYYRNFWIKGSNGDIITPNQIQQATISDGIPKGAIN